MNARKLSDYYKAIADAEDALAACPRSLDDWKAASSVGEQPPAEEEYQSAVTSARNVVLANDPASPKGALLGTLSTVPTADEKSLVDAGLTKDTAAALLTRAAALRADALKLEA